MRLRSSDIIIVILIASGMAFLSADHTSGDEKERWKEIALLETARWLPTSVAFSPEGKLMVLGGAAGEVAAFDSHTRERKWKTSVGGALAAVAFSADGASVLATFQDGVPLLDSATGQAGAVLEAKKSRPTAVAAFPDRKIGNEKKLTTHKIVFGNARGYFVKTWIVPESAGGIELNTAGENQPADPQAVPLAVDPRGRSVILTGPGNRETGKNVLWAWVAGEYEEGSPRNRILKGHDRPSFLPPGRRTARPSRPATPPGR